mmetsp:Transcript_1959/g.3487  ORF Transcript_1959/g.3487 Transcript_1959/m.3487 type:complete len:280 (-) Transcript_1959:1090-1929(-)|eukprot:CAMPEP_0182444368 /NCGR_PEP_ID=MMETSP1172-20130603/2837_1 /TAXON_ID=708627 /ORGANISM="Timspurckia oligopyrenoides, Strain CCMP3278" /LENGTH=279 /DNA_ID=CAMNT_0024639907 /DNA_START=1642 /DNA_END=2481 /DNA_ORIENTATION=-
MVLVEKDQLENGGGKFQLGLDEEVDVVEENDEAGSSEDGAGSKNEDDSEDGEEDEELNSSGSEAEEDVGVMKSAAQRKLGAALASMIGNQAQESIPIKQQIVQARKSIDAEKRKYEQEAAQKRESKRVKKLISERAHVVPTIDRELDRERRLLKAATEGVVTLFNAVSKFQNDTASVGLNIPKDSKAAANLSKDAFLTLLKEGAKTKKTEYEKPEKNPSRAKWNALNEPILKDVGSMKHVGRYANEKDDFSDEGDTEGIQELELEESASEAEFEFEEED